MTAPAPPSGAVSRRPPREDLGQVAEWWHADTLPYLAVVPTQGGEPAVDVHTGPAGQRIKGITDPRELRQMAWLLLRAADWLAAERAAGSEAEPEPEPEAQLSIFEALEVPA